MREFLMRCTLLCGIAMSIFLTSAASADRDGRITTPGSVCSARSNVAMQSSESSTSKIVIRSPS